MVVASQGKLPKGAFCLFAAQARHATPRGETAAVCGPIRHHGAIAGLWLEQQAIRMTVDSETFTRL